jgi:hypothetical protein
MMSPVQKVQLFWERGHPARGWLRRIRKMRAGCPRSQGISTKHSSARAFCTGINDALNAFAGKAVPGVKIKSVTMFRESLSLG